MISIANAGRKLRTVAKSTEDWPSIDEHLPGFKDDVALYDHQRTVIKSLIDIEDARTLVIYAHDYGHIAKGAIVADSSACVLSEPFGSGKTIMLLGLILARPVPLRMRPTQIMAVRPWNRRVARDNPQFDIELLRTYTGPRALIRPTLIVVGSAVLVQWQEAIEQFTHLRVLTVSGHHDLLQFRAHYEDYTLGRFDIVLLKAGRTSVTQNGRKTSQTTLAAIASHMDGSVWARVIYDDYDTIDVGGSTMLPAIFTVFVSTTKAQDNAAAAPRHIAYETTAQAIDSLVPDVKSAMKDTVLYGAFNVRNTAEYTKKSTNMPRVQVYRYVYDNPGDAYMRLLGKMGDDDAIRIMEMLNGDAIGTAAEHMGIKTTSVSSIFERVLDKKHKRYMTSLNVLAAANRLLERMRELPEGRHTIAEVGVIETALSKAQTPKIEITSPALERAVNDLIVDYTVRKEQDGSAIHRVIDNVKEGECQVCRLPLDEGSVIIIKCCGVIVCDICGIKGCQIKRGFDYKTRGTTLNGKCCHCLATIYPKEDFIYLDQDFDVGSLLKAHSFEDTDDKVAEVAVRPPPVVERGPKLCALLQIIRGQTPPERAKIPLIVPRVVNGDTIIPTTGARKVVVFASWNETLVSIEDMLVDEKIAFIRLRGTAAEKAADLREFKDGAASVLLINSLETCAGVNAQFATDLVFMHKNNNAAIESQGVGRVQRIGRTCSAQIHFLCYKNERDRV